MSPPQRPWSRIARSVAVAAALAVLGGLAPGPARAEDPDPSDPGPGLVPVGTDPAGDATRWREAALARATSDPAAAFDALARLHDEVPDVLLPVVPRDDGETGLFLPAREVAESIWAVLPAADRERAEARWGAEARWLERRAREGDDAALAALAETRLLTRIGRRAALAAADRDLAAGRAAAAARRLERLARIAGPTVPAEAAACVARLADAHALAGGSRAVARLAERFAALRDLPVRGGGRERPLGARLEDALGRAALAGRAPPPSAPAPALRGPEALWSRSLADAGLLEEPPDAGPFAFDDAGAVRRPTVGALVDGDDVILAGERSVECLDALTGLRRWRFPARGPEGWTYAPSVRLEPHDVPLRTVTVAGGLVLVVLGGPPAQGEFTWLDRPVRLDRELHESRARLLALDRATGALRWATGLPGERDPLLGDPACGCLSPPLAAGDSVYALFGRRRGRAEIHLVSLALADGRPRWTAFLAAGENPLGTGTGGRGRLATGPARAAPWGERPSLAGDEVCVVPHAGFAAGVEATSGRVRWLHAFPRPDADFPVPVLLRPSARNVPLAHAGAWVLAPMESAGVLALEQGTGRRLWAAGEADLGAPVRDLLGALAGPGGGPRVLLAGEAEVSFDPQDPTALVAVGAPGPDLESWAGRSVEAGGRAWRVALGTLAPLGRAGEDPTTAVALPPEGPPGRVPPDGDLHRLPWGWLVVSHARVAAVADRERALAEADRAREGIDPGRALAADALAARLRGDVDRLAAAAADARRRPAAPEGDDAVADAVARQVAALVEARVAGTPQAEGTPDLAPLLASLPGLPPAARAEACAAAYLHLRAREDGPAVVALLEAWIAAPPSATVAWGGALLREDLAAVQFLATLRAEPWAAAALAGREERAARALAGAATGSEADLREALRRAAGTAAAGAARRELRRRLEAAGRLADAAGVVADERLDPGPPSPGFAPGDRARVAGLLLEEASLLARAGEIERARGLLSYLVPWAPAGLADAEGRTPRALAEDLRARHGWSPRAGPVRTLALWPDQPPRTREERSSVGVAAVAGPGAALAGPRVLVERGLHLEVWDAERGEKVADLPAEDEGWFGAALREVDPWVPERGVLVTTVTAGEPGDLSGVEPGDWILSWDGRPVAGIADFMQRVSRVPPGREVEIAVWRRGEPVLSRFRAGRRPAAQGRGSVDRARVHAAADGRLVVPTRTGLLSADLKAAEGTWLWRWGEDGVVRQAVVSGEVGVVAIDRGADHDLLVAVGLADGGERWRRRVDGTVSRVRAEGSAVVVATEHPARALVLDRWDGSLRLEVPLHERRWDEYARTLVPDETHAVHAGRLWSVAPEGEGTRLAVRNTATGALEWSAAYEPEASESGPSTWTDPSLSAHGIVAAITGRNAVRLIVPDPVGGAPMHDLALADDLMTGQAHYGPVDLEARVFVGGSTLYLLRNTGVAARGAGGTYDPGASVLVLGLDWDRLTGATGEAGTGRAVLLHAHARMMTGSGRRAPWVLSAQASPEGLLVAGGLFYDAPSPDRPECTWVPSYLEEADAGGEARNGRYFNVPFAAEEVGDPRWQPPARVGDRLFVPTDEGMKVLPVRR